jgi:hypothetical protein
MGFKVFLRGLWVSCVGFGFVDFFFGRVVWGLWWVLVGWGVFGPGLGVQLGASLYFGFWVSRAFCSGRVSVEAFVSCIFRVY